MQENTLKSVNGLPDEGSAPATVPDVLDTLEAMSRAAAPIVETACLALCDEFAAIGARLADIRGAGAEDREKLVAAQACCARIVMIVQFQDRHTQSMQDMVSLLQYLRGQLAPGAVPLRLDRLAARLKLQESRNLLANAGTTDCGDEPAGSCGMELF